MDAADWNGLKSSSSSDGSAGAEDSVLGEEGKEVGKATGFFGDSCEDVDDVDDESESDLSRVVALDFCG